jgi:paraquat-inducible protein A
LLSLVPMADARTRRSYATAFALSALLLYVPANLLPIFEHASFGRQQEMTIWAGVIELVEASEMTLAAIVFIASMVIPLIKIVGVFWVSVALGRDTSPKLVGRGLAFLERIGPWSMLDVFLLAVAISVVRFGDLTYIVPRAGIFAFAAVVVLTIIATQNLRAAADAQGVTP